jgi:hypothetical protein
MARGSPAGRKRDEGARGSGRAAASEITVLFASAPGWGLGLRRVVWATAMMAVAARAAERSYGGVARRPA